MAAPYLIGTADSSANTATLPVAVVTGTTAGDAIVVYAGTSGTTTVTGVSDSRGNVYAQQNTTTAQVDASTWVADTTGNPGGTIALIAGTDTITVTYSLASNNVKAAVAAGVTGYSGTDAAPVPASNAGSTTPAAASGTLAQAAEVIFWGFANGNAGGAPTGFTNCANIGTASGGAAEFLSLAYAITASTASVTGSCTIVSTRWCAQVVSLRATGTPGPDLARALGLTGYVIDPGGGTDAQGTLHTGN